MVNLPKWFKILGIVVAVLVVAILIAGALAVPYRSTRPPTGYILGVFTGIAAFFGSFMNMNYLLAGTVSTNPILLFIAIFLVLAWKTAGWWGLDRCILPALGTPWSPGLIFKEEGGPPRQSPAQQSSQA